MMLMIFILNINFDVGRLNAMDLARTDIKDKFCQSDGMKLIDNFFGSAPKASSDPRAMSPLMPANVSQYKILKPILLPVFFAK